MERVCVTSFAQNKIYQHKHDKDIFTKFKCVRVQEIELYKPPTGADPENFSRGSPTFTYNCGERGIVDLLINKFLSLSLSLCCSAVIKPDRDHGDEFRLHVEYV